MHDPERAATLAAVLALPVREPALDQLVQLATRVLPATAAVLSTTRENSEFYKAWSGIPEPLAQRRMVPLVESLARSVLGDGRVVAFEDTAATGNKLAQAFDWVAWLGVPLRFEGAPIGALWAADTVPRSWQSEHIARLEELAATAVHVLASLADRRMLDASLRDRTARYEALASSVGHGVWCAELEQAVPTRLPAADQVQRIIEHARLSECNAAFARAFGAAFQEDLLGARLSALFDPGAAGPRSALAEFVRSGYSLARMRVPGPVGGAGPREWTGNLEGVVEEGHLVRVWGVVHSLARDAHDAIQVARESDEPGRGALRAEAIGRLASGVAHEFNNLLTTIRGRAELALRDHEDEPTAADLIEIRKATDRAVTLTRQLSAFGREHVARPELLRPDRVAAAIETVLQHLTGEGAEFATRYAPDTGRILADVGGIERALVHIVAWLRDVAPAGGRILITTENTDVVQTTAGPALTVAPGPCVALGVTHSRLRLDADIIARIVEPEFSPLGLGGSEGLVAALAFVRRSGGDLRITSDPEGTRLALLFPRQAEIPGRAAETAAETPVRGGGAETVLIVEDEEGVRAVARRTLLLQGYTVMEAENAQVALELASAYAGHIHVLLTDVVMPGLTGTQLAQQIQARRPDTRVVLMSGYTGDLLPEDAVRRGTAFLEKPFTPMTLARVVRQTLDRTS